MTSDQISSSAWYAYETSFGEGKLHICMTSRDLSGIHVLHPLITLRIQAPKPELEAYINERIEHSTFLVNSTTRDNALKVKIVDTIMQKSDRM
jgi:hypothetical protein